MFTMILSFLFLVLPLASTCWLALIGVHPVLAVAVGLVLLLAIGKGMNGGPS